jgi:excisionase family DNA binding protein
MTVVVGGGPSQRCLDISLNIDYLLFLYKIWDIMPYKGINKMHPVNGRLEVAKYEASLLGRLSAEEAHLLLSGLISLEGSIAALRQPVPPVLANLKVRLEQAIDRPEEKTQRALTTQDVARQLNCSVRHVRQLAKQGRIRLLKQGTIGRGRSSLFDPQSVEAYLPHRRRKATKR